MAPVGFLDNLWKFDIVIVFRLDSPPLSSSSSSRSGRSSSSSATPVEI